MKKVTTDLTRENIANWKELVLKEYNFKANGSTIQCGHLHPLNKVKRQVGMIFQQMGFEEKPANANSYVESSFWNFDVLFQPQQHPARDAHDTFFLKNPSTAKTLHEHKEYLEKDKYYSVDRVFMNESVDRTHLAEFHQIEGVICGKGLSLGHLLGVLEEFFSRMGMSSKLRLKPAFNLYMEPNMEIFSYHEGFKKWVEVGNSGMFRPEMLRSMGFPEDVRAIAWGLSLDGPTMIRYGVNNIRDLFGHKVDLKLIEKNPICGIRLQGTDPDAYDLNFLVQTY
ncbi:OLC1v1019504C1 [Oldenlandia corymbosa var. corymbosa]|uniref:phenylalanine--tRNA ligase n=1 Tax=Oldenlandia corymbosa var. corymbosa TaxID=529605 RepID=A0AAV1EE47_OLDCO|nr:OLC1v1019504C1 [Oldenlandia corymbosa var. corymbosa]